MNNRVRFLAFLLCVTSASVRPADDPPSDWVDPDTGHRVIRLSSEAGSQTLYFHDNAYSATGEKYVFNSPSGIMLLDITKLGAHAPKAELVVPAVGGTYMARRSRELYFTRRGAAAGEVFAYDYDSRTTRRVRHATRTLINADETFTATSVAAEDPTGKIPRPALREPRPQLERMFPGRKLDELTPLQQYAVTKEEGLARRAINPDPMAFLFTNLRTGEANTLGHQYGWLNHMQFNRVGKADALPHRSRRVVRALQRLARQHAFHGRRRRQDPGCVLDGRDVDQPVHRAARRDTEAREARQHGEALASQDRFEHVDRTRVAALAQPEERLATHVTIRVGARDVQ